ncbi:MAG: enolase C-terminal domain-like protein, partial [Thermoplasmatota archaeon]
KSSLVPIAGAELVGGWPVLERLLAADALDIYQPDATFSGLSDTKRCIEAAGAGARRYAPHTWTNGFGLLLNAHLLALANAKQHAPTMLEYPIDEPGWTEDARDACLANGLRAERGTVRLPNTPGIGAVLDARALRRHGTRFYNGTKMTVARDLIRARGLADVLRTARAKKAAK